MLSSFVLSLIDFGPFLDSSIIACLPLYQEELISKYNQTKQFIACCSVGEINLRSVTKSYDASGHVIHDNKLTSS